MKKIIIYSLVLSAMLATGGIVAADKGGEGIAKTCTTIQSGELKTSDGSTIETGFDNWGYNYQGHLFNGMYCDSYRDAIWCQPYKDIKLQMKWNDAWLSNKDCDGDGLLDRHYGYDSYIGSGAWLTNHQSGEYESDGEICEWNYFIKIVAAPADAYAKEGVWYTAEGIEIGEVIWGAFAIIQEVENDHCAGLNGMQYVSPAGAGLGKYKENEHPLENAEEVAPGVFYLGKSMDKGKVVEGYAFMIKNKKSFVKPGTICGDGTCDPGENINKCPADCGGGDPEEPDTSSCYDFLAKGAKWKTVEPYIVNLSNEEGLEEEFIMGNLADNIVKWETEAGVDILGEGNSTEDVLEADFYTTDNKNEVYFANLGETNTIAFAVVWGIFEGSPFNRELVEWDMVFNDAFTWSEDATDSITEMDFENIATHELGHAVGLGDLYNDACSDQTMYGYSWEGNIQKRTLESGDIAGIQKLYEN